MNKKFNYNFIEKTIVGSNAAIKRANKGLNSGLLLKYWKSCIQLMSQIQVLLQ